MQEQRNKDTKLDVSVKVYPVKEPGTLLAFASVSLGGYFAINGVRVMNGEKGPFVAMPSRKEKDGQYSLDIVMKYSIKEGDKTTDLTDTISAVLMMDGTEWKIVSLTPTNMGIEDMTLEKENT